MSWQLIVKEEAYQDMGAAFDYYEEQQAGLGDRFLREVKKRISYIQKYPFHFAKDDKDFRQALIAKFPYLIIYEIEEDLITIFACFHTSQDPLKKPQ